MTQEAENIVTTLLAEKGKKFDEDQKCISSYNQSIVFLPADVQPGEIVRVLLGEVTEKKDSRGKVMYFARHAPAPVTDDVLTQIRAEAKVLSSMLTFDTETALALLRARHGTVVDAWKGYRYYYLDGSGAVYASVFSSAILPLLENLKRDSSAIEPLLWVLGGTKPAEDSLYLKRERGEEIDWRFTVPPLGDSEVDQLEAKVANCQLLLSDPLVEMRAGELHSESWNAQQWPVGFLSSPRYVREFSDKNDVPTLVEIEYGQDIVGKPLIAYGVDIPSLPTKSSWHKTRAEAEKTLQETTERLNKLCKIWQLREEMKPLIDELNVRRQRLGLSTIHCERDRIKVGGKGYEYTEKNLTLFEQEAVDKEAEKVKTTMETAMQEAREREEAEAAKKEVEEAKKVDRESAEREADLKRREAAGSIIRSLRVWVHISSQVGDAGAYVVTKSGELRLHDHDEYERSHGRGAHHVIWDFIEESEGVVEWTASSSSAQRIPTLPVLKKPVNGWTPAQLEALQKIEKGFGIESSDGWVHTIKYQHPTPKGLGASRSELNALADWFNKGK